MKKIILIIGLFIFGAIIATSRTQQNEAPALGEGVIIHHIPSPSPLQRLSRKAVYTASPSIAILPNGTYVVSCNEFGAGSTARESGITYLYASKDRGVSWTKLTKLEDMKRGSLFVHDGDLYLFGYTAAPGDIIIRKSTDGGATWTEPTDEEHGLLHRGNYGGTPFNPVVYDDRTWMAVGGKRVMSAPIDANLLHADSWTRSRIANTENGPLGPDLTITEAQLVASPQTGVVLMPKVQHPDPHMVLLHVESPTKVRDPSTEDWVSFIGGEKKFFATYDPVSNLFFALTNPVFPAYTNRGVPFQLIRNVGALLVSADLRDWEVYQVFLYSPHVEFEAFQYFNAAIDGDDLIVASRTALHVDPNRPPRGHDSNLITFHRIHDFRLPKETGLPIN